MTDLMPTMPGFYCLDPHMLVWVRFDTMIEMMVYYNHCRCECRVVEDPITEAVV